MKRKVIFVAGSRGRVGSSATMGLLKLAGVDIGGRHGKINPANFKNPKGHFELFSIEYGFYRKHFKKEYFGTDAVPSPHIVINKVNKIKNEFKKLIDAEFGNCKVIALKGVGYFFLPIVYALRELYDIRIIALHRNTPDRVKSSLRMRDHNYPKGHTFTYKQIEKTAIGWDKFADVMMKKYSKFKYLHINFEDLIRSPVVTAKKIYKFTGVDPLSDEQIVQWIDKKLVNRKKI